MKEYRLVSWPELSEPFRRTAYRRMLTDMSHRFMSMPQLIDCSGLNRSMVRQFVEMLELRKLLIERESAAPESLFGSLRPLGGWLKRAIAPAQHH